MDEKQILKEIAYYSRVINEYKKRNIPTNSYKTFIKPSSVYKYVKKESPVSVIQPAQNTSRTVLINPNFKHKVLINPHFKQPPPTKIHVNPKLLNTIVVKSDVTKPASSTPKCISSPKIKILSTPKLKTPARKRRVSVRSKYKIIRSSVLNTTIVKKSSISRNQYKIDRRSSNARNKSLLLKKRSLSVSDTIRRKLFKNKTWKNAQNTVVTKEIKPIKNTNVKHKRCLLNIKGQRYVMGANKKTLKLIPNKGTTNTTNLYKKISVKGITYVKSSPNTYIRTSKQVSSDSLNKSKQKSANKLRKNNVPCPVYRRYGKCRRKEAGRCNFLHNPNQIFLCKKFLQGACLDQACPLSHKVSLEKMPTCKYFLEGFCRSNECPYLHVKINPKADICRNFLEGFCSDGAQCCKRHQFLCPTFERHGKCPKRRCLYPHKTKEDKPAEKNTVPPVDVQEKKLEKRDEKEESVEIVEKARYYVNDVPVEIEDDNNEHQVEEEVSINDSNVDDESVELKRPQLGLLPSFIAFE